MMANEQRSPSSAAPPIAPLLKRKPLCTIQRRRYDRHGISGAADLGSPLGHIREELSDAEIAAAIARLMARRKELYEARHPGGEGGQAQAAAANRRLGRGAQNARDVDPFASSTAKATGKHPATVRRAASRGQALGAEILQKVAGTGLMGRPTLGESRKVGPAASDRRLLLMIETQIWRLPVREVISICAVRLTDPSHTRQSTCSRLGPRRVSPVRPVVSRRRGALLPENQNPNVAADRPSEPLLPCVRPARSRGGF